MVWEILQIKMILLLQEQNKSLTKQIEVLTEQVR